MCRWVASGLSSVVHGPQKLYVLLFCYPDLFWSVSPEHREFESNINLLSCIKRLNLRSYLLDVMKSEGLLTKKGKKLAIGLYRSISNYVTGNVYMT
jgi:hypothetical protein